MLQILVVCDLIIAGRQQLKQYFGHSAARYLQLESLLSSSASHLVDVVARFLRDEVAAHRAGFSSGGTSASDCLELNLKFIVELLKTAERGSKYLHRFLRRHKRPFSFCCFLVTICREASPRFALSISVAFSIQTVSIFVHDRLS